MHHICMLLYHELTRRDLRNSLSEEMHVGVIPVCPGVHKSLSNLPEKNEKISLISG